MLRGLEPHGRRRLRGGLWCGPARGRRLTAFGRPNGSEPASEAVTRIGTPRMVSLMGRESESERQDLHSTEVFRREPCASRELSPAFDLALGLGQEEAKVRFGAGADLVGQRLHLGENASGLLRITFGSLESGVPAQ